MTQRLRSIVAASFVAVGVVSLAACSVGSGTISGSPPASPGAPTEANVASPAGLSAAPSAAGSSISPAASDLPAASTVSGGQPPSGSPCLLLDKTTIDTTLSLAVGDPIPSGKDLCSWLSKTPSGGVTVSIIDPSEVAGFVLGMTGAPGRTVQGIGVQAAGFQLTGLASPLPPTHAQVVVDFGTWGLSVDVSGPAVTLDDAVSLARVVSGT